jgi:secondary thiamine-phosphate synthase enzyme
MEGRGLAPVSVAPRGLERSPAAGPVTFVSDVVQLTTTEPLQILDLTSRVERFLELARLETGCVSLQSLHTTCALAVNEHEPRLLADLRALLERLAPRGAGYAHDALHLRSHVPPAERPNGHAHAKAMLLRTAETLHVVSGRLQLGRWQRVLLLELDGPRARELSLVGIGTVRR